MRMVGRSGLIALGSDEQTLWEELYHRKALREFCGDFGGNFGRGGVAVVVFIVFGYISPRY